ncbi:hypothetical protein [Methylomonas sp.]|jgi:hypothetical protein|nr:hypothetical protein [Methylomonas sp.]
MNAKVSKPVIVMWLCWLVGCAQYQAKPLTEQAIQQQLETP